VQLRKLLVNVALVYKAISSRLIEHLERGVRDHNGTGLSFMVCISVEASLSCVVCHLFPPPPAVR
jgi:hypothetical protein